jgi:hypothetical protein
MSVSTGPPPTVERGSSASPRSVRFETFRSLIDHPNFRVYWIGAVVGALFIASSSRTKSRGQLQLRMLLVFGITLELFSFSRWLLVSVPLIFGMGLASMAYNSLNQTFLQSLVDDEMRGRVMSLLTLMTPACSPWAGSRPGSSATASACPSPFCLAGSSARSSA